jgi:hypothetical protein
LVEAFGIRVQLEGRGGRFWRITKAWVVGGWYSVLLQSIRYLVYLVLGYYIGLQWHGARSEDEATAEKVSGPIYCFGRREAFRGNEFPTILKGRTYIVYRIPGPSILRHCVVLYTLSNR